MFLMNLEDRNEQPVELLDDRNRLSSLIDFMCDLEDEMGCSIATALREARNRRATRKGACDEQAH